MKQDYLLDTNAFFNILKAHDNGSLDKIVDELGPLDEGSLYISTITKIEIISVLGKYARGNAGGFQKCNCVISENGDICQNNRYTKKRKAWNKKVIKGWIKLIKDSMDNKSKLMTLTLIPFDGTIIAKAEKIIELALRFSFASMDALIAATAQNEIDKGHSIVVVTSDKSLKACLSQNGIPWKDIFN